MIDDAKIKLADQIGQSANIYNCRHFAEIKAVFESFVLGLSMNQVSVITSSN